MSVTFIYPNDMFNKFTVDDEFTDEYHSAIKLGFNVVLFDSTELEDSRIKLKGTIPEGSTVVYRGWMLNIERYVLLENTILGLGSKLLTSSSMYATAHFMSGWIDELDELTFKTKLFDAPVDVQEVVNSIPDWSGYFIKDYVKSVYGFTNEIKKDELFATVSAFLEEQGNWLAGGIAIREFVSIPDDAVEIRGWYVNGVWHKTLHPKFANNSFTPVIDKKLLDTLSNKLDKLGLIFATVDFVELSPGEWAVIEIGDGQVSGLPHTVDELTRFEDIYALLALFKSF